MKKFLYKISIFGVISLIIYLTSAFLVEVFFHEPVLTTSVSFDKKMKFLKMQNTEKVNILAIGSSMALNNLNSNIIDSGDYFEGKYLNLGAWGLQMTDIFKLTVYFAEKYSPKLIILSCSLTDFELEGSYFVLPENRILDDYFNENIFKLFINHVDINSYLERNLEIENSENHIFDYKSLKYDKNGGVVLDVKSPNIDTARWNRPVRNPKEMQYDALGNLMNYLKKYGIKFVVVQCPVKMKTETLAIDKNIISNHLQKVKQITENYDNMFINLYSELNLNNEDFCDTYHMNSEASRKFTKRVFDILDSTDYLK